MNKFKVPLTPSYNTRGIKPDSNITGGLDQRKLNCYNDIITNQLSNISTPYLCKRPAGVNSGNFVGSTISSAYLIGPNPTNPVYNMLFYLDSTTPKVNNQLGVISSLAVGGGRPSFLDYGLFGSTIYATVQLAGNAAYYSSDGDTWTAISDGEYTDSNPRGKLEHMDGYAFQLRADNYIGHSDLNSISAWSASSRIKKTILYDIPIGLAKYKNQLLAFGSETCEMFYNAGNVTGSVLARIPQLFTKIGLCTGNPASTDTSGRGHYYTVLKDKLFFVGKENLAGGASLGFYAYEGNRVEEIKVPPAMLRLLNELGFYSIDKVSFKGKSAVSILLTNPTSTSGHRWLMFFPEEQDWFEWTSDVFCPINNNGYMLGQKKSGADTTANTYIFSDTVYTDTTNSTATNYPMTIQINIPEEDGEWHFMSECGVVADTNRTATSVSIEKSTDDYQNWVSVGTIDMTKNKKVKYGMGTYRDMAIRLSYTGANDIRLESFYANLS